MNLNEIEDFIDSFIKLNNREPLETEIIDNLNDKMDILMIKKMEKFLAHLQHTTN